MITAMIRTTSPHPTTRQPGSSLIEISFEKGTTVTFGNWFNSAGHPIREVAIWEANGNLHSLHPVTDDNDFANALIEAEALENSW